MTKKERKIKREALKTAQLLAKYGKLAAVILSGRKVRTSDAKKILEKEKTPSDRFYELILEVERKKLSERFL